MPDVRDDWRALAAEPMEGVYYGRLTRADLRAVARRSLERLEAAERERDHALLVFETEKAVVDRMKAALAGMLEIAAADTGMTAVLEAARDAFADCRQLYSAAALRGARGKEA